MNEKQLRQGQFVANTTKWTGNCALLYFALHGYRNKNRLCPSVPDGY